MCESDVKPSLDGCGMSCNDLDVLAGLTTPGLSLSRARALSLSLSPSLPPSLTTHTHTDTQTHTHTHLHAYAQALVRNVNSEGFISSEGK